MAFWISIEFDIVRYVLIFLMIFGHNLGTKERSCFVLDRPLQRC
jgi:fucose 4-O-acetylase-like acetyltransferase